MPTVAIIGAGPAGSVAAIILARAGWHVRLIEQHRFPRDKVCGECVSALGLESLTRLGLFDEMVKLEPAVLSRCVIHTPRGAHYDLNLSSPMWGLSRRSLDEHLLNKARDCGVQIIQPARCERIETEPLRLNIRHLECNEIEELGPDWLILADGKHRSGVAIKDFGIKAHFQNIPAPTDAIELFGFDGAYGGVAPIEQNHWNVAFSVPEQRLREHKRDIDCLVARLMNENRAFAERIGEAEPISDWLASPLPRFGIAQRWPNRVIPIGNAATAIEPVGGEGMGLAIRSAELAAQYLIEGRSADCLRDQYRRLWNIRRFASRAGGLVLSSPIASKCLLPILDISPALAGLSLRLLGKPTGVGVGRALPAD